MFIYGHIDTVGVHLMVTLML